jgi:hypothetical protein
MRLYMIVLALGLALPSAEAGPPTPTILYKFTGGIDGALPYTTMVLGPGDALYGGTIEGGMQSGGTIFQLVPPAVEGGTVAETTIHVFTGYAGEADGATPGSLISAGGVVVFCTALPWLEGQTFQTERSSNYRRRHLLAGRGPKPFSISSRAAMTANNLTHWCMRQTAASMARQAGVAPGAPPAAG